MLEEKKNKFFEIINAHKLLIKINKDKIPKFYLDDVDDGGHPYGYYDDTIEELNTNGYKGSLLRIKYLNSLNNVGKFINRYDIDISCIKKSTIEKIHQECRLNALKKAAYSEPEDDADNDNVSNDEIKNDTDNEEIEDDKTFADNVKEQYRLF